MPKTTSLPDADLYGNLGTIADASWDERWSRFSLEQLHTYLAGVASCGVLSMEQMEALIQGHAPPPSTWLPTNTCLVEHVPMVERLRTDVARGAVAKVQTPNEFAAWCDQMGVALPWAFVHELQRIGGPSPIAPSTPQSTVVIKVPAWAPLKIQATNTKAQKRRPGRPNSSEQKYEVLVRDGIRIMMEAARCGQVLGIREVAAALATTTCGLGLSAATIERRLKSKLPIEQARVTAAKSLAHRMAKTAKSR
jgi:hypothetical protein